MSKAIYWQRGETLDYMNSTTSAIEAGTILVLGSRIGVAAADIPAGELGEVNVDGVYKMPKTEDDVIAMGAAVRYDPAAGTIGLPAAAVATQSDDESSKDDSGADADEDTTVPAGYAAAPAAAADTEVLVKINA